MLSRVLDTVLDRTLAPGYSRLGYLQRADVATIRILSGRAIRRDELPTQFVTAARPAAGSP